MVDILLINPPVMMPEVDKHARILPPLSLGYIAAVLLENDYSVDFIDMNVPMKSDYNIGWGFEVQRLFEDLKTEIKNKKPLILGISTHTETYPNSLKIAEIAKQIYPNIITVLGGSHVTFLPKEALKINSVDIVVRNEGEFTMLELAEYFIEGIGNMNKILGINYRRNNEFVSNKNRSFIKNLDDLPFPARQLFKLKLYPNPGNLLTARGCPGKCIFCAASAMSGGEYRMRKPETVMSEIFYMYEKYHMNNFVFIDDTFTVSRDRTKKICNMIIKSGLDIQWSCSSRVDVVTKEILKIMAKAGCKNINFGVESGSQAILKSIKKGITIKQVLNGVKWAVKFGITPVCSFMIPNPNDTKETIKKTKGLINKLISQGCHISIAVTTPFPGTYLYKNARQLGVKIISDKWEDFNCSTPVMTTKNFSLKEIYKLRTSILDFRDSTKPNGDS